MSTQNSRFRNSIRLLAICLAIFGTALLFTMSTDTGNAQKSVEEKTSVPFALTGEAERRRRNAAAALLTPPQTPHNLVAAFYDVQNFPTAKLLLNNKSLHPIEVRPTLYNLDGDTFEPPPVIAPPNSHIFVNLTDWTNLGGDSFLRGSLKLFHVGKDLVLGTQIYLEDEEHSLSFEERLAELGKFDSRRLEAIWRMPSNQATVKIILSNTSAATISASARLSKKPHHTGNVQTFTLLPHQTRVLDLRTDFEDGNQFANAEIVGLSIEHDGEKSDLKAHGFISDPPKGYSNIITFSNPNTAKSKELHGTGLHLGRLGGEKLEPLVSVKNVGTSTANVTTTVPYTRIDGTIGTVNLDPINLSPGEMRLLNMNKTEQAARREDIQIAGLEIVSDVGPGSIIANVQSVSESSNQVYRVPMFDPFVQTSSTGGYPWRIDETSSTFVYVKNTSDEEQEYVSYLTWGDDIEYMIGLKSISPHQTIQIDVKRLRDEQVPDERGLTIPLNLESGQIQWTMHSEVFLENQPLKRFELVGRSEQIDTVNGVSSSYACQNCCDKTASGVVTPDVFSEPEVGETVQFRAYQYGYNCFMNYGPLEVTNDVSWYSTNNNIATVNGSGLATIVNAGTVFIGASWTAEVSDDYDGYCPILRPEPLTSAPEVANPVLFERPLEPDCSLCTTENIFLGNSVGLTARPKVQKIQYQEPGTSNYIDITAALYILKGTSVTFKAIPVPNDTTFSSGHPTWSGTSGATGTGQTKSITFDTVSSNTTDFKTVTASVNSSVTVNVIVYELIGALNPQVFFNGRSQSRYGLAERINLGFLVSPGVTAQQIGGLIWSVTSGSGTISPASEGSGTYTAPGFSSSETLSLSIVNGPSKGVAYTQTKTVVAPTGAVARLTPGTSVGHTNGNCSVGFSLQPYLLPTDVSFSELGFIEGAVAAQAFGYYSSQNGDIHPISGPTVINSCDFILGCKADFTDQVSTDEPTTPCSTGSFTWAIPWMYVVGSNPLSAVPFYTATHHMFNTPPDKVSIQKAGLGPFTKAISDPTTFIFP